MTACLEPAVTMLLLGAGDCRHILKTLAKAYLHPKRKVHVSMTAKSGVELWLEHSACMNELWLEHSACMNELWLEHSACMN